MKLKTLKELDDEVKDVCCRNYCQDKFIEKVKQEAIKWVKEGPVDKKIIGFILHFFNITEEDLNAK